MKLERQNGSLELMLSLFGALMLCATVVVWLVIPAIKEYSLLDQKCEVEKEEALRLQQTYDRLYETRQLQGGSDAAIAEAFENELDMPGVRKWLKSYLGPCEATLTETGKEGVQRMTVTAELHSPLAFYDLAEALGEAPYVLELVTPLRMQRTKEGVETVLHLQVVREGHL